MTKRKFIYWKSADLLDKFAEQEQMRILIDFTAKGYLQVVHVSPETDITTLIISLKLVNDYNALAYALQDISQNLNDNRFMCELSEKGIHTESVSMPLDFDAFEDLGELDDLDDPTGNPLD